MTLRIRLRRGGKKCHPCYSIVVADSASPRDGKFIEKLGIYHPMLPKDHAERFLIDRARAEHWFKVGAHPTDSLLKLLFKAGVPLPRKDKLRWENKVKIWADRVSVN